MLRRPVTAIAAFVRRQAFLCRWVAAMTIALVLVGGLEYYWAANQLESRLLNHVTDGHRQQVASLEGSLRWAGSREEQLGVIHDAIADMEDDDDVIYVGVFDSSGNEVLATRAGVEAVDPLEVQQVIDSQQPAYAEEVDADEAGDPNRYEFLLPLSTPEGVYVIKIEQWRGLVGEVVEDLRQRRILGLLAVILLAVPLSYLLGGRGLRRRHTEASQLASTDALTGIPGRRPFRPLLTAALADPANAYVSLALIDIDNFKGVNDKLGHSYGDRVLVALGQAFDALRASDTAFRLGGDEFAVVLPGAEDSETGSVLERVRAGFADRMPGITISCGVASVPHGSEVSLQELWERADSALYEAKRLGRNHTVAFSGLTVGVTVDADKLDAVHELCASNGKASVAFQPIWDLHRGCILGHEVLLRLPDDVPLSGPAEAFELADRFGVASQLDAMARREVLHAVKQRPWCGGLLFVNVHPAALRDLDFDDFAAEVRDAGLDHTCVVLEVTEQSDLDNPTTVRALKRASARGFKLALDDLGAGNAGLRALTHTQFHVLKLDRQVVARLGVDPAADAVVAAAATFVRGTGGLVIAEGIEDVLKLQAVLEDSTWDGGNSPPPLAGQGYLLGYPAGSPQAMDNRLEVLEQSVPFDAPQ